MQLLNGKYTIKKDNHCAILIKTEEKISSKDIYKEDKLIKKAGEKVVTEVHTYHTTFKEVLNKILDYECFDCKEISDLLNKLSELESIINEINKKIKS